LTEEVGDLWLSAPGRVPYGAAYQAMHELAARRAAGEIPDTLLLLEHPPVYTAGRRTDPAHLLLAEADIRRAGAELHHVDRGGSVTFHGPGQLVGYPIVDLGSPPDVIRYLRMVEEAIILACADLGASVGRAARGDTGVWVDDRKVCAIGVRVSRGVTLHGFALNCTTDLAWFGAIVPCGLPDRSVTSLSRLTGRSVAVEEALPVVAGRFGEVFGRRLVPTGEEVAWAFEEGPVEARPAVIPSGRRVSATAWPAGILRGAL
jgi:lipoyl(octanoyl) transferase